jgi:hypothetical protein
MKNVANANEEIDQGNILKCKKEAFLSYFNSILDDELDFAVNILDKYV